MQNEQITRMIEQTMIRCPHCNVLYVPDSSDVVRLHENSHRFEKLGDYSVQRMTQPVLLEGVRCMCGREAVHFARIKVSGFDTNEMYCTECGIVMRSPGSDLNGAWLQSHWKKIHGIRAQAQFKERRHWDGSQDGIKETVPYCSNCGNRIEDLGAPYCSWCKAMLNEPEVKE